MSEAAQNSQEITRKSASNLALAFILLPPEKRKAMATLYAFCREVDDVADDDSIPVEEKRSELLKWREDLERVYDPTQVPLISTNRELQETLKHFPLPKKHFEELLDGVGTDLDQNRFETLEELELYCYRVASAVGLLSIEIFGYRSEAVRDYAIYLGKALQLTNILRDPKVDAQRGFIYLPLELLKKFEVQESEILKGIYSDRYALLAKHIAERARHFYQKANTTLPAAERSSMIAAELMGAVYWQLLLKLEKCDYDVFEVELVRISKPVKIALILKTWLKALLKLKSPNYGA